MILDRLKEINRIQHSIEFNKLDYKTKDGKNYNFSKILLSIIFLTNIHKEVLSVEDAHKKQSKLFKESSDINESEKPIKTSLFLKT